MYYTFFNIVITIKNNKNDEIWFFRTFIVSILIILKTKYH